MNLEGALFLAADTMRSRAYAQAMITRGFAPGHCVLVRAPGRRGSGQAAQAAANRDFGDVFAADLSIPLETTLGESCDEIQTFDRGSVNDAAVVKAIHTAGASLVIYSGFGGEIVQSPMLEAGPPLLHMHAGWLPAYRGSTTIYYSYLAERACGVSAILLRESIDTGPIVARRRYPPPPPGADVDHEYDSAIRADLLCRVLDHYARTGGLPDPVQQSPGDGRVYYVIHPVLKHIALNAIHGGIRSRDL